MKEVSSEQAETSFLGVPTNQVDPFSLDSVVMSRSFNPQKIVIYGVSGIGKSTFASTFPKPIFLRTEDGVSAMNVPTFPKVASNMDEVVQACRALYTGNHDYQTLVIDSLDWLEPLVWKKICSMEGKVNIEDFGFGKGYVKVDDEWRGLQKCLDALRARRNMHIVTIAHAVSSTFDPPDCESYQRYTLKLHKRAASLWMEWSDMLLFVNYKTNIVSGSETAKSKAKGSGNRIIYTAERPAYQAKSRWKLDDAIDIGTDTTWCEFHKQLQEATVGAYHYADAR